MKTPGRPDEILFNGRVLASHLTEYEKDIYVAGAMSGEAKYREWMRAQVEALRARPIATFDGYTGLVALDQVLALLDRGIDG